MVCDIYIRMYALMNLGIGMCFINKAGAFDNSVQQVCVHGHV